jgi:DNA-binding response OmpR family regulator
MMTSLPQYTVLAVDDSESNLDILVAVLSDDYEVTVAMDGRTALEMVRTVQPDLILLDIMMPGIHGYEVCNKLKLDKDTRDIPIIFVTSKTSISYEAAGLELGAVDYITKPFNPIIIRARVKTHLALRNARLELQELLEKTLGGSSKVLMDILALNNPIAFNRANRLMRYMNTIVEYLEVPDSWQFELAAMLSQIGCITVPRDVLTRIFSDQDVTEEDRKLYSTHPETGRELLSKIPRLETVAEIVARQLLPMDKMSETRGLRDKDPATLGGEVLNAVIEFDQLISQGNELQEAFIKMRARGLASQSLIDAMEKSIKVDKAKKVPKKISAKELLNSMIIDQDIFDDTGVLLIKKGCEVSLAVMRVLQRYAELKIINEPIRVLVPSI